MNDPDPIPPGFDLSARQSKPYQPVPSPVAHLYAGFHIIADVTGRDMEEIFDALEGVLCKRGHPDSDEPCAVEELASTTHGDIDVVFRWVNGDV